VDQSQRPARINEGREEEDAEGQPDPPAVDLARDRALVAARELGLDLGARPPLDDVPRRVVDDDLGDVRAVLLEEVDLPLVATTGAETGSNPHPPELTRKVPGHGLGCDRLRPARAQREAGGRLGLRGRPRELVGPPAVERRLVGGIGGKIGARLRGARDREHAGDGDQRGQREPQSAQAHSGMATGSPVERVPEPALSRPTAPRSRVRSWRTRRRRAYCGEAA
jgi:hypothetical protein